MDKIERRTTASGWLDGRAEAATGGDASGVDGAAPRSRRGWVNRQIVTARLTALAVLAAACQAPPDAAQAQPEGYLSPPCLGVPIAYSARHDQVAWSCQDGDVQIVRSDAKQAYATVKAAFFMAPYWIEEDTRGVSLSRFRSASAGALARVQRIDLSNGRMSELRLSMPDSDLVRAMDVNSLGRCALVASGSDADSDRRIRVYRYAGATAGSIDLSGRPPIDVRVPAHTAAAIGDPVQSRLRCATSADGELVLFAADLVRPGDGRLQPPTFRLMRITAADRITLAEGAGGYWLPQPRAADRLAVLDDFEGAVLDLPVDTAGPVSWRKIPGARWIAYDPSRGTGIRAVSATDAGSLRTAQICLAKLEAPVCAGPSFPAYAGRILEGGSGTPGSGFLVMADFIEGVPPTRASDPVTSRSGYRWLQLPAQ